MQQLMKSNFIENGYISARRKREDFLIETHFHDFFELEYILSGTGTYTVDGISYPIEAGQVFFLTPMNFHCVDSRDSELYNVMFAGNACSDAILQGLIRHAPVVLDAPAKSRPFFETVLQEMCDSAEDRDYLVTLLEALLAKLEKESAGDAPAKPMSAVSQAELYIFTHFRSQMSLTDVADVVALSPGYFSRLFKAEKGVNFKTYLNRMRFEYAKRLLDYTDRTVMQVCADCGFDDYPNFIRRFRQYTGLYPVQYRQRNT